MLNTRFASLNARPSSPVRPTSSQPLFAGRKDDLAQAEQACRELGIDPEAVKDTVVLQPKPNTSPTSLKKLEDDDPSVRKREQNRLAQQAYRDRQKAHLGALREALKNPARFFQPRHAETIIAASTLAQHQAPVEVSDTDAAFEWDDDFIQPEPHQSPRKAAGRSQSPTVPDNLFTQWMEQHHLGLHHQGQPEDHQELVREIDSPEGVPDMLFPNLDEPKESMPSPSHPMPQSGWHNPFSMIPNHPANLLLPQMQEEDEFFNQFKASGLKGQGHSGHHR